MKIILLKNPRTANTGLAKVAVQYSLPVPVQAGADTFVVNHPSAGGLRINKSSKSCFRR